MGAEIENSLGDNDLNFLSSGDNISELVNDAGYITINDIPVDESNLQNVTDNGNETTNDIKILSLIGDSYTSSNIIENNGSLQHAEDPFGGIYNSHYSVYNLGISSIVGTESRNLSTDEYSLNIQNTDNENLGLNGKISINSTDGLGSPSLVLTNSQGKKGYLKDTNILNDITLQFPNKESGEYIIATISDIPSVDEFAAIDYVNQQDDLKVDKIIGKGLSTNDYTTEEKNKLFGIEVGAEVNVNADWDSVTGDSRILNKPNIPINTSDLVNDSNFVSDASYVHTDNNYTTTEQTKLAGIQDGAEVNVNADWNATVGDAVILNKPSIPSIAGLATVTYVDQQDDLKVDKVTGYSLTKNDLTDALKSLYDGAVGWISTNGNNLLSHLTNYSNPHQVTASQVGAYTKSEVDTIADNKVDKILGKGLSTNDYTNADKTSVIATASTGVYSFTGLVKTSSTQFSIGAATGIIVDSGLNYQVTYAGSTGNTTPFLTTADSTFVLIKSDNTILLQATFPTPKQRRENIYIGKVIHPDRTTILNVNNTVDFVYSPMSALRDLWSPLKLINDGIVVTPNGVNLKINTSAGSLFGNGINYIADPLSPNSLAIAATVQSTFMYRTQTGGTFTDTTNLDPSYYDVAGVRTLIPGANARATNQRIYLFPTGQLRIQYGQQWYSSLTNAISGIETESFIEYPNNKDNAILVGIISLVKNASNLTDITDARFSFVSKFGELSGGTGGLSTTTLQQAYDNSITPEVTTNPTLGALSLKQGSGADTDNVLEVQNSGGAIKANILGDGSIHATRYVVDGGASSQFLKGDGSLDSSTYAIGGGTATGTNTGDNATNTQYSGLAASKEDASNKVTTFTGNETSVVKFPVVKAIIDYFDISRIKTILGITTLSGSNTGDQDLSGLLPKTNLSGTVNYIQKSTGTQTIGDSLLYEFGSNVGIGTNNPGATLELYHSSLPSLRFNDGATNSNISYLGGILNIGTPFSTSFSVNNSEKMRLNTLGRLGINTTAPSEMLEVVGNIKATSFIKSGGTSVQFLKADGSIDSNTYALASSLHNPVTLGTANGLSLSTQVLSLGLASASANGALSSTDWSTFNNKQNALTNPITGTGTTNYIPKFTGTSALGNSLIYDNGTNVGIGTTSPSEKLDVNGNLIVRSGGVLGGVSTSDYGILTLKGGYALSTGSQAKIEIRGYEGGGGTQGAIISYTNGTERMRIMQSGLVGIGTTALNAKLNIKGLSNLIRFQDDGAYLEYYNTANTVRNGYIQMNSASNARINVEIAQGLSIYTSASERMTITSTGNVGIGTTSPSAKLHVNKSESGSNPSAVLRLENTGSAYTSKMILTDGVTNDANISYIGATQSLSFGIGASLNQMILNPSGNVGIGTIAPAYKLEVNGSINVYPNNFFRYDGDTGIIGSATSIGGSSNQLGIRASNDILFATNGANERMRITSAGNIGLGTSSPYSPLQVGNYTGIGGYSKGTIATLVGAFNGSYPSLFIGTTDATSTQGKGGSIGFGGNTEAGSSPYTFAQIKGLKESSGGSYSGYLSFCVTPSGSDANTERMRISSNGNVGIGTTSPFGKLTVAGTFFAGDLLGSNPNMFVSDNDLLMQGKNGVAMYLEDGLASFGYSPGGDFIGVRASHSDGVFMRNEIYSQFGLMPNSNELRVAGAMIQGDSVPANPITPVKWIKIYNDDDASYYFMPVYQ